MAEWQFSSENTGGYCLPQMHSFYKSLPLINEKTELIISLTTIQ
jgi:hypothetical protein